MRLRIIYLFVLLLTAHGLSAQKGTNRVHSYVDSALHLLQNNSLYAGNVPWDSVRAALQERTAAMDSAEQAFTAMTGLFQLLGDRHAAYYTGELQYKISDTILTQRYSDSLKAAWAAGPSIRRRMLDSIAFLGLPYMGANSRTQVDTLSNWIADAVTYLAQQGPRGWIIDLRLCSGGNIRPLLGGLASFFEPGILGYYIGADGQVVDVLSLEHNAFKINDTIEARAQRPAPALQNQKVVVLTGPGTASSAEALAAMFQERPNTVLLGTATAGLANAINGYVFNQEDAYFLISVARLGNKNKERLPEQVVPDIVYTGTASYAAPALDDAVKLAMRWLLAK